MQSQGSPSLSKAEVQKLREKGNTSFKAKKWSSAVQFYTQAINGIKSAEKGNNGSPLPAYEMNKILSNRSAALLKLGQKEKALADAEAALVLDPKWTKIYHRKALALLELKRVEDACAAYDAALAVDPENGFMKKMRASVFQKLPLTSPSQFLEKYTSLKNKNLRLRLATLAAFWNSSKRQERLDILGELVALVSGQSSDSPHVQQTMKAYKKEQMEPLPMKNYADLTIPTEWLQWYEGLQSVQKVALLKALWADCTKIEHDLIAKDLQAFFKVESTAN